MRKAVSFHPEAQDEFVDAELYYSLVSSGLDLEFRREILAAIEKVCDLPTAFPKYLSQTRKCLVDRFPYLIVYKEIGERIFVFAIAHTSRLPGYWRHRLN